MTYNNIYCLTVSVGQESECGLAESSDSGCLTSCIQGLLRALISRPDWRRIHFQHLACVDSVLYDLSHQGSQLLSDCWLKAAFGSSPPQPLHGEAYNIIIKVGFIRTSDQEDWERERERDGSHSCLKSNLRSDSPSHCLFLSFSIP